MPRISDDKECISKRHLPFFHVKAVLTQEGMHIAFMSTKFSPEEKKYSATEQELLAGIKALKEFRCYL